MSYTLELRPLPKSASSIPDATFSAEESAAMLRAVLRLFERWELNDDQAGVLLGGVSKRTLARWKHSLPKVIGVDLAFRLSNLLGIHKALRILFRDAQRSYTWIHKDNDAFAGQSALNLMLAGQITDLMRVRHYLDAQRSPW